MGRWGISMTKYDSKSIFDWSGHVKNPDAHHKSHQNNNTNDEGAGAINIDSSIVDIGSPAFVGITPVDIAPNPPTGGWVTIDASAYVAAGATGLSLHVVNTTGSVAWTFGVRKTGSTDDRKRYIGLDAHNWRCVGLDASRQFDLHIQANAVKYVKVYINGYFATDAYFFDNGIDKTPSAGSWQDIDISGDTISTDIAIGAIFEVSSAGTTSRLWGMRKKGSTDDRKIGEIGFNMNYGFMIGVDANEICQGYVENTDMQMWLLGYFKLGVVFNTNATDVSLTTASVWTDLPAIISQDGVTPAVGVIIEVVNNDNTHYYTYALRENGSAESIYKAINLHGMGIIEADGSGIIEGIINNTNIDFFVIGYFADTHTINNINALKTEISSTPDTYKQDITIGDDDVRIYYNALDHIWQINGVEKMPLTSAGVLEAYSITLTNPLPLA